MFQLKEEAMGKTKHENAILAKEKLESLKSQINEIKDIEVGIDIGIEGNFMIVLIALFDSKKDLDSYQAHPNHQAVVPFIKEISNGRSAIDYLI